MEDCATSQNVSCTSFIASSFISMLTYTSQRCANCNVYYYQKDNHPKACQYHTGDTEKLPSHYGAALDTPYLRRYEYLKTILFHPLNCCFIRLCPILGTQNWCAQEYLYFNRPCRIYRGLLRKHWLLCISINSIALPATCNGRVFI